MDRGLRCCSTELEEKPADGAQFSDLPHAALQPKNYASWQKDFLQGLLATQRLRIFRCPSLKAVAKPGESEAEFKASIALAARESRDAAVEILRKKYAPNWPLCRRDLHVPRRQCKQKERASQARLQTAISLGSTLLGAILGRKTLSSATLSKAATTARESAERSRKARRPPLPNKLQKLSAGRLRRWKRRLKPRVRPRRKPNRRSKWSKSSPLGRGCRFV